jgi:hypothetical protein
MTSTRLRKRISGQGQPAPVLDDLVDLPVLCRQHHRRKLAELPSPSPLALVSNHVVRDAYLIMMRCVIIAVVHLQELDTEGLDAIVR